MLNLRFKINFSILDRVRIDSFIQKILIFFYFWKVLRLPRLLPVVGGGARDVPISEVEEEEDPRQQSSGPLSILMTLLTLLHNTNIYTPDTTIIFIVTLRKPS